MTTVDLVIISITFDTMVPKSHATSEHKKPPLAIAD